jgi:Putative peptidoglycan binding domain
MTYNFNLEVLISGGRHSMRQIATLVFFASLPVMSFAQGMPLRQDQEKQALQLEHDWKEIRKTDSAGWDKFKASQVLDAQQALAQFGYGTVFTAALDDRTQEALRNYQRRNGLPATGDVDARTWVQLQEDKNALKPEIPLGPLYEFLDSDWNNSVKVEGVWLDQGKEPDAKTPFSTAVVECSKLASLCVAANNNGSGYIHLEYFGIARWDQYEIATTPNDLPCGRETLRITRADKTLLLTNTAAYKNADACTKLFGPPSALRVNILGNFEKIMNARLKELRSAEARVKLIGPDARRRAGLTD